MRSLNCAVINLLDSPCNCIRSTETDKGTGDLTFHVPLVETQRAAPVDTTGFFRLVPHNVAFLMYAFCLWRVFDWLYRETQTVWGRRHTTPGCLILAHRRCSVLHSVALFILVSVMLTGRCSQHYHVLFLRPILICLPITSPLSLSFSITYPTFACISQRVYCRLRPFHFHWFIVLCSV
jgi:hypothetical protein